MASDSWRTEMVLAEVFRAGLETAIRGYLESQGCGDGPIFGIASLPRIEVENERDASIRGWEIHSLVRVLDAELKGGGK